MSFTKYEWWGTFFLYGSPLISLILIGFIHSLAIVQIIATASNFTYVSVRMSEAASICSVKKSVLRKFVLNFTLEILKLDSGTGAFLRILWNF